MKKMSVGRQIYGHVEHLHEKLAKTDSFLVRTLAKKLSEKNLAKKLSEKT